MNDYFALKNRNNSADGHFLIEINDQTFKGDFGNIKGISSNEYYVLVLPRIDFAELKKR
jgi:hypothetical protein